MLEPRAGLPINRIVCVSKTAVASIFDCTGNEFLPLGTMMNRKITAPRAPDNKSKNERLKLCTSLLAIIQNN
jgi:hypothetical protein